MYAAAAAMLANNVLSLALFSALEEVAIALATTVSGWLNAILLFTLLMRRGHWPLDRPTLRRIALTLGVSVVMAIVLRMAALSLGFAFDPSSSVLLQAGALAALVAAGAVLYFALAHVAGAADVGLLARNLRRKPTGGADA
jgi:putative peptidoglycan lipid II flippase